MIPSVTLHNNLFRRVEAMRAGWQSAWFSRALVFAILGVQNAVCVVHEASGQTSSAWIDSADGNWSAADNWSSDPNYPNNNLPSLGDAYHAVVNATGEPYSVSLASPVAVSSLTIDSPDANVLIEGGILRTPVVNVAQGMFSIGTMALDHLNQLRNATVSGVGTFRVDHGTLRDVTVATNAASIYLADVEGDLSLDGTTLSVERELRLFDDSLQSLTGQGTVRFESGSRFAFSNLMIAPDVLIEFTGNQTHTANGTTLVNHGTIRAINSTRLINAEITNFGTIDVARYAVIDGSDFRNFGTLRVRQNATLELIGSMTPDGIGTIVDDGATRISLGADMDNTGNVFDLALVNPTSPISFNGATIRRGTLMSSVATEYDVLNSIALDDVTVSGDLLFSGGRAFVQNDLTLDGATLGLAEVSFTDFPPHQLQGDGTLVTESIFGSELTIGEQIVVRNSDEPPVSFPDTFDIAFKENRGTIIAHPESDVIVGENLHEWRNTGLLRVPDGQLAFRGSYSIDDLGNVEAPGSEVVLGGAIDNVGRTIRFDETMGDWSLAALVLGGRIESTAVAEATLNSELTSVTLSGPSRIGHPRFDTPSLSIKEELILDSAAVSIPHGRSMDLRRDDGSAAPIRGQGEVVLRGSQPNTARIEGLFSIEPGVLIRTGIEGGNGTIGVFGLPIDNAGVIRAQGNGSVLLINGDLQNSGTVSAADSGTLQISAEQFTNNGTMQLEGGRMQIDATSFENDIDGLFTGAGDLAVIGEFANSGEMAIGAPIGNLAVDGRVRLNPTSRLVLEIGGAAEGEFDTLSIDGDLFVGGQLDIAFVEDFQLVPNHRFDVIEISGFAFGQFDGLADGAVVGTYNDVDLLISYSQGDGNDITLHTEFQGDFDSDLAYTVADVNALTSAMFEGNHPMEFDLTGDGLVDVADLAEWLLQAGQADLGPGATYLIGDVDFSGIVNSNDLGILLNRYTDTVTMGWTNGDFNGDKIVDRIDLGLLLNNFHSGPAPAAVPEPSGNALWQWSFCIFALVASRSRRGRL